MDTRSILINMLEQLLEDMMVLHQQGAGYYSCIPVIRRYNKLLSKAESVFSDDKDGLFETFDPLEEKDPKDPADKMRVIQGIRVEIGQLLALLRYDVEKVEEEEAAAREESTE